MNTPLLPFTVCHISDDHTYVIAVDHVMAASADAALSEALEQGMVDPVVFAGHIVAEASE